MIIETDLEKIKQIAEKKWDENWEFRSFLKGYNITIKKLDSIVHGLLANVSKKVDCKACANCCREISPVLNSEDIERYAGGLKTTPKRFKQEYLVKDDEEFPEGFIFKTMPCPFLNGNLCTHYELRPEDCRSFPHLHKEEFVFRLIGVVENYAVCPIVFNVYENLKAELW